jgi:Protein of unknown function (DUF1018)
MGGTGMNTMNRSAELAITTEQIKLIHVLKKRLAWDDETYKHYLHHNFDVSSSKSLSYSGAGQCITRMSAILNDVSKPVEVKQSGEWGWGKEKFEALAGRDPGKFATPKQLRMLDAMWSDISRAGNAAARDAAFEVFLKRRFKIISIAAVSQSDVGRIRRALQAMIEDASRQKTPVVTT